MQRKCQYFLCTDTVGTYIRAVSFSGAARVSALKIECTSAYRTGGRCGVCVLSPPELLGTVSFAVLGGVRRRKHRTFPGIVCKFTERCGRAKLGKPAVWTQFFFLQAHCSKVEVEQYQLATMTTEPDIISKAANWMRRMSRGCVENTVLQSVTESKTDGLEQRGEVQEQKFFRR